MHATRNGEGALKRHSAASARSLYSRKDGPPFASGAVFNAAAAPATDSRASVALADANLKVTAEGLLLLDLVMPVREDRSGDLRRFASHCEPDWMSMRWSEAPSV
jgi:hypothetical protein